MRTWWGKADGLNRNVPSLATARYITPTKIVTISPGHNGIAAETVAEPGWFVRRGADLVVRDLRVRERLIAVACP